MFIVGMNLLCTASRPHHRSSLLNHTFVNVAHSFQHKRLDSRFDRLNPFGCQSYWLTHELVQLEDHFYGEQANVGVRMIHCRRNQMLKGRPPVPLVLVAADLFKNLVNYFQTPKDNPPGPLLRFGSLLGHQHYLVNQNSNVNFGVLRENLNQ